MLSTTILVLASYSKQSLYRPSCQQVKFAILAAAAVHVHSSFLLLFLEPIYIAIADNKMRQVKRQQLAHQAFFALGSSCSRAAVLQCLRCVYGSAGYEHEEAVQMFEIVDADHGMLMTASCCHSNHIESGKCTGWPWKKAVCLSF